MKTIHKFQPGLIGIGLLILAFVPQPVISAEKVKLTYGPFNCQISVQSLETFAKTGKITNELRLYSKFVDQETLNQLRFWLNNRFRSDRVTVYRFTRTPQGQAFLTELGTAIKTHPQHNGFYGIRSALVQAADTPDNSDGWTIIEAMYHFPTEDLQINTQELFQLKRFWSASNSNSQDAFEVFAPPSTN